MSEFLWSFNLCLFILIVSSVSVAGWPPIGKELLTGLTICSFCILTVCIFCYFRFGFEDGIWVLIAPVPCHCILVTFTIIYRIHVGHESFLSNIVEKKDLSVCINLGNNFIHFKLML